MNYFINPEPDTGLTALQGLLLSIALVAAIAGYAVGA